MKKTSNNLIPASTVLIIRNGKNDLEVFMVVRHHQIDFASGALLFPGGGEGSLPPKPPPRFSKNFQRKLCRKLFRVKSECFACSLCLW